jgi:hypothetical protein
MPENLGRNDDFLEQRWKAALSGFSNRNYSRAFRLRDRGLKFARSRSATRRPARDTGVGPRPAALAGLCGPFELPMSPIGNSVVEGSADMPRTLPIRRS